MSSVDYKKLDFWIIAETATEILKRKEEMELQFLTLLMSSRCDDISNEDFAELDKQAKKLKNKLGNKPGKIK